MIPNLEKKEIFVTGGAGLIGSFLCERLVNKGYKVFVVDDFSKGQLGNLKYIEKDIEIIEADLQDLSQTQKCLNKAKNILISLKVILNPCPDNGCIWCNISPNAKILLL